jgi:hypothetical protein
LEHIPWNLAELISKEFVADPVMSQRFPNPTFNLGGLIPIAFVVPITPVDLVFPEYEM